MKAERPLVPDESVEVVLSNCVLNLVRSEDKEQVFEGMFRVVRRGGHVAIVLAEVIGKISNHFRFAGLMVRSANE